MFPVTGLVVALHGKETSDGDFFVQDILEAGLAPQKPLPLGSGAVPLIYLSFAGLSSVVVVFLFFLEGGTVGVGLVAFGVLCWCYHYHWLHILLGLL